ncbi:MAG: CotH kinase family protein [Deltaproteobacteria bacterium]|nr:CotH kinase family protein [Deltaproteobacteria bacterium]MBN2671852.1 CotH kinase family protein [Deltaproteobacteria bacterium]
MNTRYMKLIWKMCPPVVLCCALLFACQSDYLDEEIDGSVSTDSPEERSSDDSESTPPAETDSEDSASGADSATEQDTDSDTNELLFPDTDWDVTRIGDMVFADEQILEYHIVMDEALYEEMLEDGNDEVYREATLTVQGGGADKWFPKVGLRYKGDYSLHHCWYSGHRVYSGDCAKLSMKIKFNEYYEHARFDGLKKVSLHAMSSDGSKMRERLAYQMYSEFGVGVSRTAFAKVYINDEPPVLMLAVEQVDGRYTARHYTDMDSDGDTDGGDGNLYKEIWPRDTLSEYAVRAALKTNDDSDDAADVSRFVEFGDAVSSASAGSFSTDMAPYVELPQLFRYMAVDRAIKNWDGINAFYWTERPHNFYWYDDIADTGLFRLIPWDLDNTFPLHDPYMDPVINEADTPIPDWNVLPLSCSPVWVWDHSCTVIPPGCDSLINLLAATGWEEFVSLGNELLDGPFQYSAVESKVSLWEAQLAPLVEEDPFLSVSAWQTQVEELRGILQQCIDDFSAHLETGYVVEE